jgi:hypothetical protein
MMAIALLIVLLSVSVASIGSSVASADEVFTIGKCSNFVTNTWGNFVGAWCLANPGAILPEAGWVYIWPWAAYGEGCWVYSWGRGRWFGPYSPASDVCYAN